MQTASIRYIRFLESFDWAGLAQGLALAAVLLLVPAPVCAKDAGQFVVAFSQHVTTELGQPGLSSEERKERFAALVDEGLDLNAAGQLMLGRYWHQASTTDREAFERSFRDYLVAHFGTKIRGFGDHPLNVLGTHDGPEVSIVETSTTGRDQSDIIEWSLVPHGASWQFSDISIHDISVAAVFQSQFDTIMGRDKAGIPAVIEVLRSKSSE